MCTRAFFIMYCLLKLTHSCLLFLSLLIVTVSAENRNCDQTQCPGPVRFYEDLKCKPIFKKPGDCCAVRYDCSNLRNRSTDKCHVNGHDYDIGQTLRAEDQVEPCDVGCHCITGSKNVATFSCALLNCFPKEAKPGCYLRLELDSCCGREEICPKSPDNVPKCHVNGNILSDGDRFVPNDDVSLICQCMKGYTGKNVTPFCRKSSCSTEIKRAYEIKNKCAPIYEYNQLPANSCSSDFRCQNSDDKVISYGSKKGQGKCEFGSLKLDIGDELNQSTTELQECVSCKCEVPPTMTCIRLSDDECKKKYPGALN